MDLLSFPTKAALFGVVMLLCWLAPTATYAELGCGLGSPHGLSCT